VAESGHRVVGALVLLTRRRSRVARIYSVAVSPRARGRGIGAALIRAAERHARRHGRTAMSLEVRKSNRAARTLYARLGYAERERLPRYYEDGAAGLRLRKALG
jgi:ribosomal-protein-alanine N-acetyltransferase